MFDHKSYITNPTADLDMKSPDDVFLRQARVGRIVAVNGSHAIVLVENDEPCESGAKKNKSPEIASLLKTETATTISFSIISALSAPMPSNDSGEEEMRVVEVEFVGEMPRNEDGTSGDFRRGTSSYPILGTTVFRASQDELRKTYACDHNTSVRIGHIQQDPSVPAMIKIDDMLGKHFAILGTTGTGKSCSVALILRRILEKMPEGHVLLLDIHREYRNSFKGIAEIISPEDISIPFWLLNFEEICEVILNQQAHRETDEEILRELIPLAKTRYIFNVRRDKGASARARDNIDFDNVMIDSPIPYRLSDLTGILEEYIGKLELRTRHAPYKRLKARLESLARDPRYAFMFSAMTIQDTMAQVLSRIFRIPVDKKPIAIVELGGLPSEIINVMVSVLARLAFDFGLWSEGKVPITFVCEEAHRYVPHDKTLGFEPTKRALSRIAKEGRKYGVSLCIVTQRPADLDPTILSQCNTVFSMRLTNERDQNILRAGVSDAASSLLEFISTMGTGEAIAFGEGVALPTRIRFDRLPEDDLPRSNSAPFTQSWSTNQADINFMHDIVSRWRSQSFKSTALANDLFEASTTIEPNSVAKTPLAAPLFSSTPSLPPLSGTVPASPTRTAASFGNIPASPIPPAAPPAPTIEVKPTSENNLADLIKRFRA